MDVAIEVRGDRESTDDLRSLRQWMVDDEALRGRVRLVTASPEPGSLGGVAETLIIALGPGGAVTAMASVLITWIRHRTGNVLVKISKPSGEVHELRASKVRVLSAEDLAEVIGRLVREIGDGS